MNSFLFIANSRLPTEKAYGVQISKMCQAFAGAGFRVELAAPFRKNLIKNDFFGYYSIPADFSFKKIPAPDFYLPGLLDKIAFGTKSSISAVILAVYALHSKPDIVYSRDELPVFLLSFFRKNVFFEAHKYSEKKSLFYRRFRKAGIKIIVISSGLKESFVRNGFEPENILVAPDGVDIGEFDIDIEKNEARVKTGLPAGRKIILYTGHLFDWKGADILAQAAGLMPENLFVFVGGTEKDVAAFREKHAGRGNVLILGHKPHSQIPVYLKAADVLVLPNSGKDELSKTYTSPLKLFEFMASKRPIAASDLPSIREILNEKNSILFKAGDSGLLAQAVKKILDDNPLADHISTQAFADVQNFTWQKRAESVLKFMSCGTVKPVPSNVMIL